MPHSSVVYALHISISARPPPMPAELADLDRSCGSSVDNRRCDDVAVGISSRRHQRYVKVLKSDEVSCRRYLKLSFSLSCHQGAISILPNSLLSLFSDHDGIGDAHGGPCHGNPYSQCTVRLRCWFCSRDTVPARFLSDRSPIFISERLLAFGCCTSLKLRMTSQPPLLQRGSPRHRFISTLLYLQLARGTMPAPSWHCGQ